MQDIMIYLETMGNRPDAAIIAIGAMEMDRYQRSLGKSFYAVIDLQSAVAAGGTIDASTVLWWLRRDDDARAQFESNGLPIVTALDQFRDWLHGCAVEDHVRIWGNGSDFDNVILAGAFQRCGLATPWDYRNNRCYRTIRNMYPDIGVDRGGIHHHALHDAQNQARHLLRIFAAIDGANHEDLQALPHQQA